ncbi:MAG: hypothetical protein R2824_34515 [Saprospiraceae bacterium]|nr:hypothetical protein [Lewinella sp.]
MDLNENPNIRLFSKGKKHYFSILRQDGKKAILTSKGYGSAKTRDNGLQTLIKNLDRLELEEKNDFFQFFVKTGNNHIIAKSVPFSSDEERQQAVDFLIRLFAEQENPAPIEAEEVENATPDLPPKYSFRLEFYVSEEQKPVRSKIEYPFTRAKKAFDGIDMATIESFLKSYLPHTEETVTTEIMPERRESTTTPIPSHQAEEKGLPAAAVTTTPKVNSRAIERVSAPLKVPKVESGIPISPSAEALDFSFINNLTGLPTGWQLKKSGQTSILMDLSKLQFPRDVYTDLTVSIFGMPLETGRKQLLVRRDFKTTESHPLVVPVRLEGLPTGSSCKFELLVKLTASDKEVPPCHLMGQSKTASIAV